MARYLFFVVAILFSIRPTFAEDKEVRDLITSHEANLVFMYDLLKSGVNPDREAQLYTNLLVSWVSYAAVADKYNIQSDMFTPRRVCEMIELMNVTYPRLLDSPKGVYPISMVSFAHKSAVPVMNSITSKYQIDCEEYFQVRANFKGRMDDLRKDR